MSGSLPLLALACGAEEIRPDHHVKENSQDAPPAKDPLADKIHALPAGGIALFDGWQIAPIPSNDAVAFLTFPAGNENDFQMIVALATPGSTGMANLHQDDPARTADYRIIDGRALILGGDTYWRQQLSAPTRRAGPWRDW